MDLIIMEAIRAIENKEIRNPYRDVKAHLTSLRYWRWWRLYSFIQWWQNCFDVADWGIRRLL